MFLFELSPGQGVQIGACTLRVLAVHAGEVVVGLFDPAKDCVFCGERPAAHVCCPVCRFETVACSECVPVRPCPQCGSPWPTG
jgi:hypothetical protein